MDHATLGHRVAQAREALGVTQSRLAEMIGIERSALSRAEKGERKLAMTKMVDIAAALGRPLAFFVRDPLPAVISRRSDPALPHETTRALDDEIEMFAGDALTLLDRGLLRPADRQSAAVPQTHADAELLAAQVRSRLGLGDAPIDHLAAVCERLGLYTYAAPLGENGPDGGCVEVDGDAGGIAVAVVNGDARSGRRRMTLAHEFGHWLCGDAYDRSAGDECEKMISSFAIHFLAPRAGVMKVWNARMDRSVHDRTLTIGSTFRLSWSASVSQLRNLGLITYSVLEQLGEHEPTRGDYVRLELSWDGEPRAPYLSPAFAAACVQGYTSRQFTAARTIELLRSTMTEDDLPEQEPESIDDVRKLFVVGSD